MTKSYLVNPITEELIREGIIVEYKKTENRTIIGADGVEYQEVAVTYSYKDPRQFNKTYKSLSSKYLKMYEGNTMAQMPHILQIALEKSINKDSVNLGYKDIMKICEDNDVKKWTRPQISKCLKKFLDAEIIFKVQDEPSRYWINIKDTYNGMLIKQIELSNRTNEIISKLDGDELNVRNRTN